MDGVSGDLEELKWRRICRAFPTLGPENHRRRHLRHLPGPNRPPSYLNRDLETDWIECFNNDHQVTEHFHEFAMGLQVDGAGNLYYAKSARMRSSRSSHGTLLRVSPDGKGTDIVATGWAANGVCLNPDGTWIMADQEGHWNPKPDQLRSRRRVLRKHDGLPRRRGHLRRRRHATALGLDHKRLRRSVELLWVPENGNWENSTGDFST